MEDALANLRLLDDEEEAFQEDEGAVTCAYQFCLVGRCLTDSVVHFPLLRNTMADLWHPIGGICITELGEKRYLFQFFHEVDIERVVAEIPWFFNNHLLILQKIPVGENPIALELNLIEFWIQVHELPPRLMTESMVKQFGHVESYCPFQLKVEPSKIVFGWDLSLRAVVRCQNTRVSRWLRAADRSQCITENLASFNHSISLNEGKDLRRNFRGFVGNHNSNPNLILLGSVQYHGTSRQTKGRDGGNDALVNELYHKIMKRIEMKSFNGSMFMFMKMMHSKEICYNRKLIGDLSHYPTIISVVFDVLAKVIMGCIDGLVFN
ncbi:hypothetical protein Gogos_004818, partial [Gossypium gossypioides]|nr:hypothetical protein [Gossypium gossypioides]